MKLDPAGAEKSLYWHGCRFGAEGATGDGREQWPDLMEWIPIEKDDAMLAPTDQQSVERDRGPEAGDACPKNDDALRGA